MVLKNELDTINLSNGSGSFKFLKTGDVFEFVNGGIMINQFQGSPIEGSANNIYLRVYENDKVFFAPILGMASESKISFGDRGVCYEGIFHDVEYRVTFVLADSHIWFWNITLKGTKTVDVVYAQDIGVAGKGGVLGNELYMSQYLDNKVLSGEYGYTVSSRQNQEQNGGFPYLQQGALGVQVVAYSTDAMQFFTKSYKLTNVPAALYGDLPSVNYQFELSYTALQTEKIHLNGEKNICFYGIFKANHTAAVTEIEFLDEVLEAYNNCNFNFTLESISNIKKSKEFGEPYASPAFTAEEVNEIFSSQKLPEFQDNTLLSFFTEEHTHVVLQEKEVLVERPHGHIITTALSQTEINYELLTATNYMYGLFAGQVVIGNTSMNKMISVPRGLLNILKHTGQRMYVKIAGQYCILTLPAAYEMGMNFAKWYYKLEDDLLLITSFMAADSTTLVLDVKSQKGRQYQFIITSQLVMGSSEYEQPVNLEQLGNTIVVTSDKSAFQSSVYPDLNYTIRLLGADFTAFDDKIFFVDHHTQSETLLTLSLNQTSAFQLIIDGKLTKDNMALKESFSLEEEYSKYKKLYKELFQDFELSIDNEHANEMDKLNETAWWYTHNAMTHFAVPHGLEQTGGAAWGTRDVCQGPLEYFIAAQHYTLARKVLIRIFEHQFLATREWPQWFMFDKIRMQPEDCHGDVVFWPIKALSDYIIATNDTSILNEMVSYCNLDASPTNEKNSILEHLKLAIQTVKERFLYDTALISYAGGDWDDTLQPANKTLSLKLVSAWTQALAYQSFTKLGEAVKSADENFSKELSFLADSIKNAFNQYLIKDGVIAGFAYCESSSKISYMLHPDDERTGIKYRLLPMTRSIISEIVDSEQAKANLSLIQEHFICPDGVRLMDTPTRYEGGISTIFVRAEQAANVGREISLQYVHAHIRYVEAMAKLGISEKAFEGLMQVNPINLKQVVKNAQLRQSNSYFSSSEGCFNDRYQYKKEFSQLRTGDIEVKGGWRIYSSGPGIYFNQLTSNVLGIRFAGDYLEIDPILPAYLNGLTFRFGNTSYKYHLNSQEPGVSKISVNGKNVAFESLQNPYRRGGAKLDRKLAGDGALIEIWN